MKRIAARLFASSPFRRGGCVVAPHIDKAPVNLRAMSISIAFREMVHYRNVPYSPKP